MQKNKLEEIVISTLLRYKAEGSPCLSLLEIYKHLNKNQRQLKLSDISDALQNNNNIKSKNGFHWLSETQENNFDKRITAAKTTSQKIKKAKRIANLLKIIPSIKSVAISGSVSMSSPKPESDIDFFIISQKNRIWITRFLTVLITHLAGQRRYKDNVNNKICLNLYIADEKSTFPIQNIASSHMISRMLPIYRKNIFTAFLNTNKNWVSKFINDFDRNFIFHKSLAKKSQPAQNKIISILESGLAKLMMRRMTKKTPLAKPPYLITNNTALIFYYPHSKNQEILEKYNKLLHSAKREFKII